MTLSKLELRSPLQQGSGNAECPKFTNHDPILAFLGVKLFTRNHSDDNTLVFCRAVVLDAAPWSACLEFVQNPVGSLGGGCTSQHIQTDLGRTGCAGKTMPIGRLHSL